MTKTQASNLLGTLMIFGFAAMLLLVACDAKGVDCRVSQTCVAGSR